MFNNWAYKLRTLIDSYTFPVLFEVKIILITVKITEITAFSNI